MRIKRPTIYLIILAILTACQMGSNPATELPVITPSISGLSSIEIDGVTRDRIREHMGMFLNSRTYTEYESGGQLLNYLVSSGEFANAEITLESADTIQADVIYAYTLMSTGQVLVAPVLVGLSLPDGTYAYFSENYSLDPQGSSVSDGVDRKTALSDAKLRLPRGRIFRLLAYGMVTPSSLEWKECKTVAVYPPEICPIGQLVEKLYPSQTKTFVLRLADEFPAGWFLIGWYFKEFAPGELVLGASIDVPLPELNQP